MGTACDEEGRCCKGYEAGLEDTEHGWVKAERRLRLRHRLKGQLGAGKGWGDFGRKGPRGWRGEGWREGHMGEEGRTRKDVRGRRLGREGDLGGRRRQGPRLVRTASV